MNIDEEDVRRIINCSSDGPESLTSLKSKSINKYQCFLIGTAIIVSLSAVFMGSYHHISSNIGSAMVYMEDLFRDYHKQYAGFISSKSIYCDSRELFDSHKILKNIRKQNIVHQVKALHQLEFALGIENDLNTIAFVGSRGVGKSLVLSYLTANFPWPENIYIYAWNTQVKDESEKFHMLRVLIERFSKCGCNLLIIENLQFSDHGLVYLVNKLIAEIANDQKQIICLYVFNLNWVEDEYHLKDQSEFLTNSLPVTHVINFKSFTKNEIRDCVYREMNLEKIRLPPEVIDEIIGTIDPVRSGCKDINSKVLLYGTIRNK
uniref:AAA+ ATPase domain-containing protein n=1 Tax=Glossina brevipalpis TaxID=37001 RepID=A0A1A9WL93_9MUSC